MGLKWYYWDWVGLFADQNLEHRGGQMRVPEVLTQVSNRVDMGHRVCIATWEISFIVHIVPQVASSGPAWRNVYSVFSTVFCLSCCLLLV